MAGAISVKFRSGEPPNAPPGSRNPTVYDAGYALAAYAL